MQHQLFHQKILPVVLLPDEENALQVADAILKGGLNIMEVPFRTASAHNSISIIRKSFPMMNIGAGTILNVSQLHRAIDSGAQFGLSPGFNPRVVEEAAKMNFPFIPGVMTPTEIEMAHEAGASILKLFPVDLIGGISFLKAMESPYRQLQLHFIPMGGINIDSMNSYLQAPNVIAIGGSWLASKKLIEAGDYQGICQNIKTALEKVRQISQSS